MKIVVGFLFAVGGIASAAQAERTGFQLMDYFSPTPIFGALSSDCWGAPEVGPRDQSNGLEDKDLREWVYWDSHIIKDDDGLYHMFASRWSQSAGHTAWMDGSRVVHATSHNLWGPYTDQGLAFTDNDGLGHNVNVLKLRAGDACGKQYAITLSGGVPGSGRVYSADSLTGPWTFLGEVQVAAGSNFSTRNNMQIILRPDGTYEAIESRGIVAISDNIMGPYTAQGDSFYSILEETADLRKLEDPTLWYSGGTYHVITNEWNMRKAFHLYSADGKTNWQLDTGLAYDPSADFVRYADGTVNHWRKIERPRAYIENGHVAAFTFAAINVEKEQDLGNDRHGSKVIVVPFDGAAFDRDLQTRAQAGHTRLR